MYSKITFVSYFSKVIIIAALFVFLPMLFSPFATSTASSYISSCICFFIITLVGVKLFLIENRYVKFYALAFIIQIVLGLGHYLYFVDSHYFSTNGSPSARFWYEFISVYDAVGRLQESRESCGLLYWMGAEEIQITHAEIWHIISFPFYFLQHKWLNYEALNVFSSILLSCNIMLLYKRKYNENKFVHKVLLFWTAYFPQFIFSDTVWRDAFGVFMISIGAVLVSISNTIISKFISFVIFGFCAFFQRTMYLVLAGISTFWGEFTRIRSVILKIFYMLLSIVLLFYLRNYAESVNGEDYNSGYVNIMSYVTLPIKIFFGMIGPFPWTNFFKNVEANPVFAWDLKDFLMGTFQLGYLYSIIFKWKHFSFKNLDTITVMGFGIMLSGFVSKQMHIGYISEGLIFTLPWFFTCIGQEYKRFLKYSFLTLLFLNLVLLMIGNLGIANLWK